MDIYPPGVIIAGRYEIAGRPLMGAMGIVYLCLDRQEDLPVALKTFKPEYLPDRAARDRFLKEGTIWIELGRHPHIVRAYGVERVGAGLEVYLVLELVAAAEGKRDASLRSWITPGRPLPLEQALLFALQIVRGMKHAAETIPGFVHRDLKPENVLVGADHLTDAKVNRLRVTDFGLARVLEETGGKSQIGNQSSAIRNQRSRILNPLGRTQLTRGAVGTPFYMAPEQWVVGGELDLRADIYAFGCILYEMVSGKMAVVGNDLRELEQAHRAGRVGELPRGLNAEVGEMLWQCLALKRDKRYGSWGAVEAAATGAYRSVSGKEAPKEEVVKGQTSADRVAAGWSYNAMGRSYYDISKFDAAVGYLERVVQIGRAEKERALESAGLGNLGAAYYSLGEARKAIQYHEQALKISREIGDRRGEGADLGSLGNAYADLGEARKAIQFYEWELVIVREIGDRRGEGAALGNLGLAYADLGEARRAIGYHEQCLAIARQIGDRASEGSALGNLGNACHRLGEARRAIGYHEQHLAIAREIGDRRGEGNALGNLGAAYYSLGEARKAIQFYEQHLEIAREIGDRRGEGADLGNLGSAYADLGDVRQAIEYYEQHLAIARQIGDVMGAAMTSCNLAMELSKQGQRAEALRHAEYAAQAFAQVGNAQYAQQAQQLIAQLRG